MFYGWRVVGGAFMAQLLVVGFFTYSVSLLISPVREAFSASLQTVMLSLSIATAMGLFLAPIAGIMIDRYPVRWLMTIGSLCVAAGFWGMSLAPTIAIYNLLFGLTMAVGNAFSASMAGTAAISRWFTSSRGRALGIAAMGTSVGGIAIPALVTWWLGSAGWRGTLENLALLTALLIAPLVCVTVRGKPSDVGLNPEGMLAGQDSRAPAGGGLTMAEIVRQPAYWYIGLSLGLLFCVYSAILANITPYATNLGQSEARASSLIMVIAVGGLVGKLVFGMGADRFNLKFGLWAAQGLVAVAFVLLATQPGYPLMLIAAASMGLAAGGQLPVWGAMLARVFGVNSFGRAMGAMGPVITLAVLPGFVVAGRMYDSYGNYTACLLLFTALIGIAAALLIPLRLDPVHES